MMDKKLVRLHSLAVKFGVEDKVIRRAISDGLIHGYKLPGSRLIFVDIDEYEAAIRQIPAVKR